MQSCSIKADLIAINVWAYSLFGECLQVLGTDQGDRYGVDRTNREERMLSTQDDAKGRWAVVYVSSSHLLVWRNATSPRMK